MAGEGKAPPSELWPEGQAPLQRPRKGAPKYTRREKHTDQRRWQKTLEGTCSCSSDRLTQKHRQRHSPVCLEGLFNLQQAVCGDSLRLLPFTCTIFLSSTRKCKQVESLSTKAVDINRHVKGRRIFCTSFRGSLIHGKGLEVVQTSRCSRPNFHWDVTASWVKRVHQLQNNESEKHLIYSHMGSLGVFIVQGPIMSLRGTFCQLWSFYSGKLHIQGMSVWLICAAFLQTRYSNTN